MKHLSLSLLLTTAVVLCCGPALADDAAEARKYGVDEKTIQKARTHAKAAHAAYLLQDYAKALAEYQTVLKLIRSPKALLGTAQCYRQLGKLDQALRAFRLYADEWRRLNPNAAPEYNVDEEIRRLEASLEARRKERDERAAKDEARREREARERAERERKERERALAMQQHSFPEDTKQSERRTKTLWGYTVLGGALACFAATGVLYGVGFSQRSSAYDRYKVATDPAEIERHRGDVESAHTKTVVGHVLLGVGAAALAFSIYELVSRPGAGETDKRTAARPRFRLLPSGPSLDLSYAF